jgi:hypothetical protein
METEGRLDVDVVEEGARSFAAAAAAENAGEDPIQDAWQRDRLHAWHRDCLRALAKGYPQE